MKSFFKKICATSEEMVILSRSAYIPYSGARALKYYIDRHSPGKKVTVIETTERKYWNKTYQLTTKNTDLLNEIISINPKYLGVSLLSVSTDYFIELLAELIAEKPDFNEHTTVIIGGAGVITDAPFVLEKFLFIKNLILVADAGEEIINNIVNCDTLDQIIAQKDKFPSSIMIKDGEIAFNNLGIQNKDITIKRNSLADIYEGIIKEPQELFFAPVNEGMILPNNDEFRSELFNIYLPLLCYGKCNFCSMTSSNFFQVSKSRILKQEDYPELVKSTWNLINYALENGVRRIFFNNDDLLTDQYFLEYLISYLYSKKELLKHHDMDFIAMARPHNILRAKKETLLKMKEIGFAQLSMGTETFYPEYLREMGKGATVEENIFAIEKLNGLGIRSLLNIMPFYPTSKIKNILYDLKFLAELYVKYNILTAVHIDFIAIPGTKTYKDFNEFITYKNLNIFEQEITIPININPVEEETQKLQKFTRANYAKIIESLKNNLPQVLITSNLESLIILMIMTKYLKDEILFNMYSKIFEKFANYYPVPINIKINELVNEFT